MGTNRRLVVYTSIFGKKDRLIEPPDIDVDFYLFTDDSSMKSSRWRIVLKNPTLDHRRNSKRMKAMPHLYFPDYEESLWVDANKVISKDVTDVEYDLIGTVPYNNKSREKRDLYDEAGLCISMNLGNCRKIISQIIDYAHDGYPRDITLWECSGIFRRHHHPDMVRLGEMWWDHIMKYSSRDRISFQYCIWKLGISPTSLEISFPRAGPHLF